MDKVSYALGLGIGRQLAQMGATDLNIDDFAEAIKDVLAGNTLKVSNKDAQTIVEAYFQKKEQKMNAPTVPCKARWPRKQERNTWPRTPRTKVW